MDAPVLAPEREGMSLVDFLATDEKIEIINGRVSKLMPNPAGHSLLIRLIVRLLEAFIGRDGIFEVFSETTFVMQGRETHDWVKGSRIPDVMLLDAAKLKAWFQSEINYRNLPFPIVPDLVIEVISENDRYHDVVEKVETYLLDGVKLIWLVDPKLKQFIIYSPEGDSPITLKGDTTLTGGDVLSGFSVPLRDLFA